MTVVFWHPDNQSLARRLNTDTLALGCLHILRLGIFQNYCSFALWALLEADVWNARAGARDVRIQIGVMRCRHDFSGGTKRKSDPNQLSASTSCKTLP